MVVGELVAELDEDDAELDDDEFDEDEFDELDDDEFGFEDDGELRLRYFSSGGRLGLGGENLGVISGVVLSGSDRNIAKLHGLGVGGEDVNDLLGGGENAVAMVAVSVP